MSISLNEKFSNLRKTNNMTQSELARRLGVSRACINGWEHDGIKPSTDSLREIAKVFHVSADYLLDLKYNATIDVEGLNSSDVLLLISIANHLREKNGNSNFNY